MFKKMVLVAEKAYDKNQLTFMTISLSKVGREVSFLRDVSKMMEKEIKAFAPPPNPTIRQLLMNENNPGRTQEYNKNLQ